MLEIAVDGLLGLLCGKPGNGGGKEVVVVNLARDVVQRAHAHDAHKLDAFGKAGAPRQTCAAGDMFK